MILSLQAIIQYLLRNLGESFSLKDMGLLFCILFLGIEVVPTQVGLFLSQHKYAYDILSTTNMSGAKDVSTPISTSHSLQLVDGTASVDSTEFRRVIGSLQYPICSKQTLSFYTQSNPKSLDNKKKAFSIFKTDHFPWHTIVKDGIPALRTFSDADWAGNIDDHTSKSAYISFLGSTPISWSSKKQRVVARSSTEAEYCALANATSETMWLLNLFHELGFKFTSTPHLLCGSKSFLHETHSNRSSFCTWLGLIRYFASQNTFILKILANLLTATTQEQDWSYSWKLNLARAYKGM